MALNVGEDWKTCRKMLIEEVYGKAEGPVQEFEIGVNKVFSKDKYETKQLKADELERRTFLDFIQAMKGFSTVTFECHRIRSEETGEISFVWSLNDIYKKKVKDFLNLALTIVNQFTEIRQCLHEIKNAYQISGKMVLALAKQTEKSVFTDIDQVIDKFTNNRQSYTIGGVIRLCQDLESPLKLLLELLQDVIDSGWTGGQFFDILHQKQQELVGDDDLYHHIIHATYKDCNEIMDAFIREWVRFTSTDSDPYFEFFIWDLCKMSLVKDGEKIDKENPPYLNSVNIQKLGHNKRSHELFAKRFVIAEGLCPQKYKSIVKTLVNIGKYKYYQEKYFDSKQTEEEDELAGLGTMEMVERSYTRNGHAILKLANAKFGLWNLVEALPSYFWGVEKNWIERFIHLTEDEDSFECMEIPTGRLGQNQLKAIFKDAISHSHIADNEFIKNFTLTIPVVDIHDFWHRPSNDLQRQKIVEMELDYATSPAFNLVYPPSVIEIYRGLFRLSHALRRCIFVLLRLKAAYRWSAMPEPMPRTAAKFPRIEDRTVSAFKHRLHHYEEENMALVSVIRFLENFYDFVFEYVVKKETYELVERIRQAKHIEEFVKYQQYYVDRIRQKSCTNDGNSKVVQKIWYFIRYANAFGRQEIDFEKALKLILRTVKSLKNWINARSSDENLNQLGIWLFGTNLTIHSGADNLTDLINNLRIDDLPRSNTSFSSNFSSESMKSETKAKRSILVDVKQGS
ncbi:unnamed protein product [Bursaphelenchus xylophilus]|uniref:Gamma-tubulin complex component n=1 Tax=Bursaphelenchus xylophilus TaxID=6326 RepID=A0A1I7RXM5_BURXY|nr:unnamed protein product [Bursaphelenchus xylophilus]CAG9126592.1 unnamed protein product [Bursaphelenchus xylophilus]